MIIKNKNSLTLYGHPLEFTVKNIFSFVFFGLLCDPDMKKIHIISVPLMDHFWRHGQKNQLFTYQVQNLEIDIYNLFFMNL